MTSTEETLSNLLKEDRRFEPPEELAANANLKEEAYARADEDREAFWAEQAERLHWDKKWDQVLDWSNPPFAKWFVGGTLNAAYNCLDRHVEDGLGDRVALHWVGEPEDDTRSVTYAELQGRGLQGGQRAHRARRREGRPGRHLHADDPRDGHRDAGLRPDRRAAHRGLRRLLRRRARHPRRRLRREGDHHRRRRLPARRGVGAQAGRRRGRARRPRADGEVEKVARGQAHRPGRRLERRASTSGGTTPWTRRRATTSASSSTPSTRSTSCTPPARPASPRASCTPPAAT